MEYGGYLEVVDNLIGDNSDSGIYLYEVDSGAEVRIEGNSITGNEDGIYVADEIRSGGLFNVDGNDVSHNGGVGLWLCGDAETLKDSEAYVLGNSFDANEGWGIYGYLEHARLDVSNCNKVTNNAGGGIYLDGSDTEMVGIHNNNVGGNTGWGLLNESEETLDATSNWWGDTSGPYHPESNAAGVGDQVSGDVAYQPWLMSACDPSSISAGLKASVRTGKPGLVVRFTDLSESGCEIVEWLWDFGDGGTSTEQNPKHTYLKPGVYSVSLTVRDACGYSDTMTMKAHITVKEVERDRTPEPARLGVSYLHIDPLQVLPGQVVNVSANVCNQGEERGTRTVSLMVNGEAVESQSVAVSGGTCQQVTFTVSRAVPGTYQVAIDGMVGQFSVLAPTIVTNTVPSSAPSDGLGTAGIVAIIVVMLVLIAALVVVFRRT